MSGFYKIYKKESVWYTNSMKKNYGVTIIELMMVILLIGMMTLIAMPLITNFGVSVKLSETSKSLQKYMLLARTYALSRSKQIPVVIYTRSATTAERRNSIRIVDPDNTALDLEKLWIAPSVVEITDVDNQDGAKGDDYEVTITFLPSGQVETDGTDGVFVHIITKGAKIDGSSYSPTTDYSSKDETDYKKCHTIVVFNNGITRLYEHGLAEPWQDYDDTDEANNETPW